MTTQSRDPAADPDDDFLVQQVGKGDEMAFTALFNRHSTHVLGYSMRIVGGNLQLAEDISQATWVKLVQAAPRYEAKGQFVAWLRTLTRNTALNELRRIRNRAETDLDADHDNSPEFHQESIEQILVNNGDVDQVREALDELPENQRVALVLWMTDKLSYTEIAKQMDTSVSSVKSLLFRARKKLEELVDPTQKVQKREGKP